MASAATVAARVATGRPAQAVDCDPVPAAGGTATCTTGSPPSPSSGITYVPPTAMTLNLDGTAQGPMTITSGTTRPSPEGVVTLVATDASLPSQITTTGDNNVGLYINGGGGGATVGIAVARGTTTTTSGTTAHGAFAEVGASGTATALVIMTGGSVTTFGDVAYGAHAITSGGGSATVTLTGGSILTNGSNAGAAGDQAFAYRGTADFTGTAGELILAGAAGAWRLQGDVDGDAVADLAIAALVPEIIAEAFLLCPLSGRCAPRR